MTAFGPTTGKPELVTSFAEFERTFGSFLPEPSSDIVNQWALNDIEGGRWWYFPLAVKGFFDNGGQRLFVKRVFSSEALASFGNLGQGMISEIVSNAACNANEISVRHLINISVNSEVQIFRGDTGAQVGDNFTVMSYDTATNSSRIRLDPYSAKALGRAQGLRTNPSALHHTAVCCQHHADLHGQVKRCLGKRPQRARPANGRSHLQDFTRCEYRREHGADDSSSPGERGKHEDQGWQCHRVERWRSCLDQWP